MDQKIINSPLAELGTSFLVKDSLHAGILLDPDNYTLEFYPKGYTQFSTIDKRNRQFVLKNIWDQAVMLRKEDSLYPFDSIPHNIKLLHDPQNTVDKYAMHVILDAPINGGILQEFDQMDLGFIPARISKQICNRSNMITGGRILKVRSNWHKKYYSVKVILGYNNKFSTFTKFGNNVRFSDIMDEIG